MVRCLEGEVAVKVKFEPLTDEAHAYMAWLKRTTAGHAKALQSCTASAASGCCPRSSSTTSPRLAAGADLLAEEIEPRSRENFPRAFSHLGLIQAALALAEAEG
jgi:hypothetical protein